MSTQNSQRADAGMAAFERTTSRWGRLTMLAGLALSLAGPVYLVAFAGLDLGAARIWIAFIAVAAVFGVFWILEPLTYFPILGSAAMYQAFMVGNISNKLLPAVIVAQSSVGARPGTRRGDLTAVMAICGAATVHLASLLVCVGLLGTWLMSVLPAELIEVSRLYILPAVMGAVLVQCVATMRQVRPTVIAVTGALVIQFVLVPLVPGLDMFATALCVVATMLLAWYLRDRRVVHRVPGASDTMTNETAHDSHDTRDTTPPKESR
ncbi:hypothetical protein DFP74_2084 [Nocardiopsis sp. Huas11]|uniref:hypothetical protein n=1 Tax=Nocardiopsis sp. Huas11 TaxID=2183912 RepID=UPI000EB2CD97|nr:hypothetical protein [Nocardiopsis sp. Huas11]RKS06452.1 hypothetical protein DFP74_2084 [Nocardiopsis sp. Huas11]